MQVMFLFFNILRLGQWEIICLCMWNNDLVCFCCVQICFIYVEFLAKSSTSLLIVFIAIAYDVDSSLELQVGVSGMWLAGADIMLNSF